MLASKHTIYLTKNHQLIGNEDCLTNVLLLNQGGHIIRANWVRKNVEQNNGSFVVLDHQQIIFKAAEKSLTDRNYYIENVDFKKKFETCCINPFDLVHDTSEIHFMFLNFLHVMWDNADPDIAAMSNLIDAFASCVYFMFINQREKMNMRTLKKMALFARENRNNETDLIALSDQLFSELPDQDSMPCKYYAQFKKASGERCEEVAEKLAAVFDAFTERDLQMMDSTDWDLAESLRFKTAVFVNVDTEDDEHSAKILLILLNYLIQQTKEHGTVLFILDSLSANYSFASLTYWMKDASNHNMSFLVICDDVEKFAESPRTERYFKRLQIAFSASVLLRKDVEIAQVNNWKQDLLSNCVATVLIPSENVGEKDDLF